MIRFTLKSVNYELSEITMKKSQLLDIVCALTLFAISNSANAAIVAGEDTSITGMDQSHTQAIKTSPSSLHGVVLTLDVPGDSGETQANENVNLFMHGVSSESPQTYSHSHINLWQLLIVASVFGILSEIYHRRSLNR
jgi:hypothetical protein